MKSRLRTSVLILTVALLTGACATSATHQAMTVQPTAGQATTVNPKLKSAVTVGEVTGGSETNPLWTSQVDNSNFKKALEDSLAIAGYLVPPGQPSRFRVDAKLNELKQPLFGLNFDVVSNVEYTVSDGGTSRSIPVTATGTGTFSDSWVGVERLRIANEKSAQQNIRGLLKELESY